MILYHGSNVVVEAPKIIRAEIGRDFGFGFYATDIKDQAVRWAIRKAKLAQRRNGTYTPYLSIYSFDPDTLDHLKYKAFPDPSAEWLDMVCACRSNPAYTHGYDIVSGKIANDNVGETVTYVLQGIMRKEDAIARLRFEQINNQICFNTEKALRCLKFEGYEKCW